MFVILSFAEVDQHGNVGVHKFNGKIMGTGGFIDISRHLEEKFSAAR